MEIKVKPIQCTPEIMVYLETVGVITRNNGRNTK